MNLQRDSGVGLVNPWSEEGYAGAAGAEQLGVSG
jgi:hypothetical protein